MHLEFLVEEESAEAVLSILVPKIIGDEIPFAIHTFEGKRDLLGKLPVRFKGYRRWLPLDWYLVVLLDNDADDCVKLKARLEQMARDARLVTRSEGGAGASYEVLNRLAIEELEAWFFGDIDALAAAYPGIPPNLGTQAKYRNPDAIKGGTWETLERVLQKAGYYQGGLPKIEAARRIAANMLPHRNRSRSFQVFRHGLQEIVTRTTPDWR